MEVQPDYVTGVELFTAVGLGVISLLALKWALDIREGYQRDKRVARFVREVIREREKNKHNDR